MSLPAYHGTPSQQLHQPPKPPSVRRTPNQSLPISTNAKPNTNGRVSLRHYKEPIDPTVLWTSSISRRSRNGQLREALTEFVRMRLAEVEPNHITFVTLLSGCANFPPGSLLFGASLHGYVRKLGLDRNNVMVGTALVDMYAKSGNVDLAGVVFHEMGERNSVTWNTMINGCMRNGQFEGAVELFDQMPQRDAISWTALISGFVKKGHFDQALDLFREMQFSRVEPDYVTIIAILSACTNLGTLSLGLWIHRFIMMHDFKDNIKVSNSLIDMYSRCGCIEYAYQIFEKMPTRTLVSWNSIIVGFAVNGHAERALEFFKMMQKDGFQPDGVSFTGALTACSHAGLVDEGLRYFDAMKRIHKITPRIEHFGCIVDLYGRAGRLKDAMDVIENMHMKPNEVVLGSLLAACRTDEDIGLAERLTTYLLQLDPGIDSNYVLLANIYAVSGNWDDSNQVRRKMKALGLQKKPGFSSVDINCSIHKFVAGDKSHIETENVYAMLDLLSLDLKLCGYVPETIAIEVY